MKLAAGPNFKSNMTLQPFQNTNVYSLLCKLIDIYCNPSNGTVEVFEHVLKNSGSKLINFDFKIFLVVFGFYYFF